MKINKLLLVAAVLATSFTSCSNDDNDGGIKGSDNRVKFASSIGGEVTQRAANNAWTAGDAIGLYMLDASSTVVGTYENTKYVTALNDGTFAAANTSEAFFYPEDGSSVTFKAYYPFATPLASNVYKIDTKDQTNLEAIDLMYSNEATTYNQTASTPALLNFKHQLSQIAFNVKVGTGVTDLTGLKIVVKGLKTAADFDVITGVISNEATKADMEFGVVLDGLTKAASNGIVLPAAATEAGCSVEFQLPAGTFNMDFASKTLPAGKRITFEVTLKEAGGEIGNPGGTIDPWEEVPGGNIELTPSTPAGLGTLASPYSVSEALTKATAGESAKWVKGYIVGSRATTFAIGAPVNTNILIAAVAGETDETKCLVIDIDGSAVQANLNIVANPTLIGKEVKIQGDLAAAVLTVAGMTNVIAQEGGAPDVPTPPSGNLFFPGANFEDWSAFTGSLTQNAHASVTQSTDGRDGSKALAIQTPSGSGTKNGYLFTVKGQDIPVANPTKITMYIKGTVTGGKSLSFNVYNGATETYFNLEDLSGDKFVAASGMNGYIGNIDTNGQWVKVTLDVTGYAFDAGQAKMFSAKFGSKATYDLLIDDITVE